MTKRQEQAAETRQLIMDTARQLLRQCPVEDLTVARITKEAGVAKGTFYVHFDTKDDLLLQLLYNSSDAAVVNLRDDKTLSFRERVTRYIHERIASILLPGTTPALLQHLMTYRMTQAYRDMRDIKYNYVRNHEFHVIRTFFIEGIERGELKPDTPSDRLTRMILYGVYGAYLQGCLWSDLKLIENWAQEFSDNIFRDLLDPWMLK